MQVVLGVWAFVVAFAAFWWWLPRRMSAKAPEVPRAAISEQSVEERDGMRWLGCSWAGERGGLPVACLRGDHFEIGFANGRLLEEMIHCLEDEFLSMIRGHVPQRWKLALLRRYVIYRNRNLPAYIPREYQVEMLGTSVGCADRHPELGDFFHRLLNYHAAQDISYMMMGNPLVTSAACTGFGAWGTATASGRLLMGRNFDWEAAEAFDRDRLVVMCEPEGRIPFVSLSWASMTGVVSGLNRAGVGIALNGAHSRLTKTVGTPAAIVARRVLEQANDLAQALEILRTMRTFVSSVWLLGSRVDRKCVVVEKTPETTCVRESEGDTIIAANHFLTDQLQDQVPPEQDDEFASTMRYARLRELLREWHGQIDVGRGVDFLRDRRLPGGRFAGNGHRGTMNAFIATHAAVMDLDAGIFWAAAPPHQLGAFVPFDVGDFSREPASGVVAPDRDVTVDDLERTARARALLARGNRLLEAGDAARAREMAERAEACNPGYYGNAWLLGRALLDTGRSSEALAALTEARERTPSSHREMREIERQLRRAREAAVSAIEPSPSSTGFDRSEDVG